MAEIRVGPRRRSRAWLLAILIIVILGAALYYLLYARTG